MEYADKAAAQAGRLELIDQHVLKNSAQLGELLNHLRTIRERIIGTEPETTPPGLRNKVPVLTAAPNGTLDTISRHLEEQVGIILNIQDELTKVGSL